MKKKHWLQFFIGAVILLVLNIAAAQVFFRIDLTQDNRYTISDATKQVLENLDDQVFVTVYLTGDLPSSFKRLENSIREQLEEFEIYGGRNIRYVFSDPTAIPEKQARNRFYKQLVDKGMQPTNLVDKEGEKQVEKIIFPWALVTYKNKEASVLLLKGNQIAGSEQIINQSVEGAEFELASAIRQLTLKEKRRIGFLEGHGELEEKQVADLINSLQEYYEVYWVNVNKAPSLEGLDAIVVAKPDTTFTEEAKYKIDQFIVKGGKAMFFIDALRTDSLSGSNTVAFPYNLNLDDLLFRYGIRLNGNMIVDLNSAFLPMNVGRIGNQPQIKLMPWPYFPLLNTFAKHPIVRNMDAVYARFVGTVDTVKAAGISKTPLIYTSQYTRVLPAPVEISLNQAGLDMNPALFTRGNLPVAYLLEGSFRSLYANRITATDPRSATFKETSAPSKIIICSDGDLLANEINPQNGRFLPLGYDRYSKNTFANKDFIVHAIDYLMDENGIIAARNKEIALRPLDKLRIREERVQWQLINLLLPVLIIAGFGLVRTYLRKRKYTTGLLQQPQVASEKI
jgi:gliding-associated putative ABC transporter substrate-binding component GldG